jgi:hypothetical protein
MIGIEASLPVNVRRVTYDSSYPTPVEQHYNSADLVAAMEASPLSNPTSSDDAKNYLCYLADLVTGLCSSRSSKADEIVICREIVHRADLLRKAIRTLAPEAIVSDLPPSIFDDMVDVIKVRFSQIRGGGRGRLKRLRRC